MLYTIILVTSAESSPPIFRAQVVFDMVSGNKNFESSYKIISESPYSYGHYVYRGTTVVVAVLYIDIIALL